MNLPAPILKKIIDACDQDSAQIAEELDAVHRLRMQLAECQRRHRLNEDGYLKKKAEIDQDIAALQQQCRHWDTHRCTGAFAGESYTACLICGAEV